MPKSTDFKRVVKLGLALPGVEEGISWGAPALKVKGRMFACVPTNRSAEPASIVVRLSFVERDIRVAAEPETYYLKPHYKDYPCVLARLGRLDDDELRDLLETGLKFVQSTIASRRRR
jgi:hypothetical protein